MNLNVGGVALTRAVEPAAQEIAVRGFDDATGMDVFPLEGEDQLALGERRWVRLSGGCPENP